MGKPCLSGVCSLPVTRIGGNGVFAIRTAGETGDALKLTSMAAVPEPATLSLVAGGLLAGVLRRRRRLAA